VKVTQNVTNAGRACSLDFFRFVICQVHDGKEKVDDWRRNFSEESRGCRATRASNRRFERFEVRTPEVRVAAPTLTALGGEFPIN